MHFLGRPETKYPTVWRRRFAFMPMVVGVRKGRDVYVWFGFYETRNLDAFTWVRRSERVGDEEVIFSVNLAY